MLRTQELFFCEYYAFVLMANHFHILIGTPKANLDGCMRHLMTEVSRRIARASNRINKIFGARYRWSILYGARDYAYVYKYVYRNPVRAALCERPELYPFSTLSQLVSGKCEIPICDKIDFYSANIPTKLQERVAWLSQPTTKEAEALIGKGLRRFEFQFSKDNAFQRSLRTLQLEYGIDMTATNQAWKTTGTNTLR